jgi:uncharacterized membrane protein
MTFDFAAWANLAIRWLHLTAGAFRWLSSHMK